MDNETLIDYCTSLITDRVRGSKHLLKKYISDAVLYQYLDIMSPSQFAWHVVNATWEIPTCYQCNSSVKFNPNKRQYAQYCSKACGYSDPSRIERIADTMMKKYGVANAANSIEIQNKKRQTIKEKYGVDHISKLDTIKEKKKATLLKNYGVDNPSKSLEIQEKKKQTNRENLGVDWPAQNAEVREKQISTTMQNYGVQYSLSNSQVRERAKNTMLQRYGVNYPQQDSAIRDKTVQTNIEKYGTRIPSQSQPIKDKIKATNQEKYGAPTWLASEQGMEHLKSVHLEKRGVHNPSLDPTVINKIKETYQKRHGVPHVNYLDKDPATVEILTNKDKFCEFVAGKSVADIVNTLDITASTVYKLSLKYDCRSSMTWNENSYEKLITNWLDSRGYDYVTHDRLVIKPFEIDIYIPQYNVGIEVGSLHFHCEAAGRTQNYHKTKWEKCFDQNITLFQWFDDDLFNKWHLTESRLLRALHNPIPVIGARKVKLSTCTYLEEQTFLTDWHVKGHTNNRNVVIAGRYNGEIIAIMSIYARQNHAVIERWATDTRYSWPGLFSKMLSNWVKDTGFVGIIESWSDNRLGNGQLYASSGFQKIRTSEPGLWYFKNDGLENRQKYQKHKLDRIFSLSENEKLLSAGEILQNRGYNKFWDAGHTLWHKIIT